MIYSNDPAKTEDSAAMFLSAITISQNKPEHHPMVYCVIGDEN